MSTRLFTSHSGISSVLFKYLVDDVFDCYGSWREDATAVEQAYRHWSSGPTGRQRDAHAAYVAALDQEQATAAGYALAVRQLERARAA